MRDHHHVADLIWQIADLLRGPYRPSQYGRIMLPMTALRRFDCVLAPNNHSPLDFDKLRADPENVGGRLKNYVAGFSEGIREVLEHFELTKEIDRMNEANVLCSVVSRLAAVDLGRERVSDRRMSLIFAKLVRRFNELANNANGNHSTPRDVIQLMVNVLFAEDHERLSEPGAAGKMLDPACGTGGMLAEAQEHLIEYHPQANLSVYGQERDKRAFATAKLHMLMKGVDHASAGRSVRYGDSLADDRFPGDTFDYFLSCPPFATNWRSQRRQVKREHDQMGFGGRFGAGLPRVNDGSLLFLQHMWRKREAVGPDGGRHGSRMAVVFGGSPLWSGGAGSGESDIRRWLIENDWLEAIIALPEQVFYNTDIGTFVWVLTNRKSARRKGKVQLIDARGEWTSGPGGGGQRGVGQKRRYLGQRQIAAIARRHGGFELTDRSRILDNDDFGYTRVTVERPLRLRYRMTVADKARFLDACPELLDDVQEVDAVLGREPIWNWNSVRERIGDVLKDRGSRWKVSEWSVFRSVFAQRDPDARAVRDRRRPSGYEPDPALRDFENLPLTVDVDSYFEQEIRPFVPDAWLDRTKDRVGCAIDFSRFFCKESSRRSVAEIDGQLREAEEAIVRLLREVTA